MTASPGEELASSRKSRAKRCRAAGTGLHHPRRHRSNNNFFSDKKTESFGGLQRDFLLDHETVSRPTTPVEDVQCFVSELNFTKIINQLINNPTSRKSALLLQALRQQITIASSSEYAKKTILYLAEKDVLALKNRKHSVVATILMGIENGQEVKEQLTRFLNALASFHVGRNYLLAIGQGRELLHQLLCALRSRRLLPSAFDHAVATIQKLSIRGSTCRELLCVGAFEWLLSTCESARISPYALPFTAALLLNLTLSSNAAALVSRHADQLVAALIALLKLKNTELCPHLNGAIYAALYYGRVRARARELKFDVQMTAKLERADCAIDQLHLPFLLKHMRGDIARPQLQSSTQEMDDAVLDHCESELDSTDQLRPVGSELAGARLLLEKLLAAERPSEAEESRDAPPGVVPLPSSTLPPSSAQATRATARRSKRRPPEESRRQVSRSEPRRLMSSSSQVTFVIDSNVRRPLTQPLPLNQLALAMKTANEARERTEKTAAIGESAKKQSAVISEGATENGKEKPARISGIPVALRRSKTTDEQKKVEHHSMHDVKESRTAREPSPQKETKNEEKEMENERVRGRTRQPLAVVASHQWTTRRPASTADLSAMEVEPHGATKEVAAPVSGSVPQRIPGDTNAGDYISVFGSRPKVPRTPDRLPLQSEVNS